MRLLTAFLASLALVCAMPAFSQTAPAPQPEKLVQYGFTGGILVIPFKFHPSDRSLTGGGTAGGYIGWRSSFAGLTVTPIISSGLSLTDAKYGTGFSVASGLIGSVANSNIHFGLVGGTDYYAKSVAYPYEGKLWLAIEVGYNFGM